MKFESIDQNEVRREAMQILARHLTPAKFLAFVASQRERNGTGRDYVLEKEKIFEGETVESLARKVEEWKKNRKE